MTLAKSQPAGCMPDQTPGTSGIALFLVCLTAALSLAPVGAVRAAGPAIEAPAAKTIVSRFRFTGAFRYKMKPENPAPIVVVTGSTRPAPVKKLAVFGPYPASRPLLDKTTTVAISQPQEIGAHLPPAVRPAPPPKKRKRVSTPTFDLDKRYSLGAAVQPAKAKSSPAQPVDQDSNRDRAASKQASVLKRIEQRFATQAPSDTSVPTNEIVAEAIPAFTASKTPERPAAVPTENPPASEPVNAAVSEPRTGKEPVASPQKPESATTRLAAADIRQRRDSIATTDRALTLPPLPVVAPSRSLRPEKPARRNVRRRAHKVAKKPAPRQPKAKKEKPATGSGLFNSAPTPAWADSAFGTIK